jgi:hypothetical protein
MFLNTACTTRFARTQNLPYKKNLTEKDVTIYLNELPERPYTTIGVLSVKPIFNRWDNVFKSMRKKAAEEGADAVIHIRTTRNYYVDLDFKQHDYRVDTYETYFGDATVFTEPEYSQNTNDISP